MGSKFINRWRTIKQVKVPNSLITNGTIALSASALSVILVLLQSSKGRYRGDSSLPATVKISHDLITQRTGYTTNPVTKGIQQLQHQTIVEVNRPRKKDSQFGVSEYVLCNPETGVPLGSRSDVVYGNKLPYFTFPECVITEHTAKWSLSKLGGSELKLYTAILYLANRKRDNEFTSAAAELRKVSGLVTATLRKALDALEERGLVWYSKTEGSYRIQLCDPYTGTPLENWDPEEEEGDPANYYTTGQKGQAKRVNLNCGDPEKVEKLIRSYVAEATRQGNGDLMIKCPFHVDHNPSCSVSPRKNGCFNCFGCGERGSLTTLIAQLKGGTEGEAIKETASALGQAVEYRQPDATALAKYDYLDKDFRLVKQVVRYPDKDGKNVFSQRQPKAGGWRWDTKGVPPMLYNSHLLPLASIVCVTEGEKDAQRVTDLHLGGSMGEILGVTSGGSDSWDASFAKDLSCRKVVLMPDADEAGERFASDVKASLEVEGVEYCVVKFDDLCFKDVSDFLDAGHTAEELSRRIDAGFLDDRGQIDNVETEEMEIQL